MFQTGLLVLTSPIPTLQRCLPAILSCATRHVNNTLYVHLAPTWQSTQCADQAAIVPCSSDIRDFITGFYAKAAATCAHLDVRILLSNISNKQATFQPHKLLYNHEILLAESHISKDLLHQYIQHCFQCKENVHFQGLDFEESTSEKESADKKQDDSCKSYAHAVLGGTFDRLHTGHKILLGEAQLMAESSLTVGVTDGNMNDKKTLCELIKPCFTRMSDVTNFLRDTKPSLEYKVVPILDPFGPSITDPQLDCIVVSEETVKGGNAVNAKRKEKGMSYLDVHIIKLVEDEHRSQEEETKISSSSARKRLLGTLWQPAKDSVISTPPFIIGLTGGIASGKSSICKRLKGLGAAVIDCDKLGHQAYAKGSSTLDKLVETFGSGVLTEEGEVNRKALGAIVFADKSELKKLNEIVWPAIAALAHEEILQHKQNGAGVVVLDAAVLLEAGWDSMVNEIWVSIVPKQEAVQRIMDRNKLSENEALQRIESQMTNQQRVDKANVILSTLWEPDVTQKQVQKAWTLLQQRIEQMTSLKHKY